jgi:hypothetical protein
MLGQLAVVDHQADDERDAAQAERVQLHEELAAGTSGAVRKPDVRSAVDHRQADRRQDQHGSDEQPVHVEVEATLEH